MAINHGWENNKREIVETAPDVLGIKSWGSEINKNKSMTALTRELDLFDKLEDTVIAVLIILINCILVALFSFCFDNFSTVSVNCFFIIM